MKSSISADNNNNQDCHDNDVVVFDHLIVERLFCRNNISTNTATTTNPNDEKKIIAMALQKCNNRTKCFVIMKCALIIQNMLLLIIIITQCCKK